MDVTIAVPTFNGEVFIKELITKALQQNTEKSFEVLIVDSGSTDKTLQIIRSFGKKVRLVEIDNKEFGHGKTRNYIAKLAKGKIILFLTQDAIPAHNKWLDEMMHPFSINDMVAIAFGKQIPRGDCMPLNKRDMTTTFNHLGNDGSLVFHYNDPYVGKDFPPTNDFFSDANSAVRKSVLLGPVPFRDVPYAEDRYLAQDILEKGYIKAYVPFGSVYHSHTYTLGQYFGRAYDEYQALKRMYPDRILVSRKEMVVGTIKESFKDYAFILRDTEYRKKHKLKWFVLAPGYNFLRRLAGRAADKGNKSILNKYRHKLSLEHKARNGKKSV